MKFSTWGDGLLKEGLDTTGFNGVRLMVNLHSWELNFEDLAMTVHVAKNLGLGVMLCIDHHVHSPYHGVPPHIDILPDGTTKITDDGERRQQGLGYVPMSWKHGWIWARDIIGAIVNSLGHSVEYIQFGDRPDVRIGWGFGPKPEAGYKDHLRIYQQAIIEDCDWKGTFVIPNTPLFPKMQKEAYKKANEEWVNDHGEKMRKFSVVKYESDFEWGVFPTNGETPPNNKPWKESIMNALNELEEYTRRTSDYILAVIKDV